MNGTETELDNGTTVVTIVQRYGRGERGIAVALNGEVIARSRWNEIKLTDGDRLEVLGAIGGGQRERR
ncbi:MAG: sulfur carrier protein ThiS [Actinomycetota bacterium]